MRYIYFPLLFFKTLKNNTQYIHLLTFCSLFVIRDGYFVKNINRERETVCKRQWAASEKARLTHKKRLLFLTGLCINLEIALLKVTQLARYFANSEDVWYWRDLLKWRYWPRGNVGADLLTTGHGKCVFWQSDSRLAWIPSVKGQTPLDLKRCKMSGCQTHKAYVSTDLFNRSARATKLLLHGIQLSFSHRLTGQDLTDPGCQCLPPLFPSTCCPLF